MNRLQTLIAILVAIVAVIIPPGLVMYIALSHNPQNEYMDATGKIEWKALFFLVAPGLLIGLVFAGIVTMTFLFIIKLVNQRRSRGNATDA